VSANNEPRTTSEEVGDLYARLNVSPNAPTEVIGAAYKALMRGTHPDLATDEADRASRETASKLLGEAHAILTDPVSRQRYDDDLRRARRHAEQLRSEKVSHQNQNIAANVAPNSEPTLVMPRGSSSAKRGSRRDSTPVVEAYDLREYDSLSPWLRYVLWRSARNNMQWRQVRNTMLARRERRFKVPLAWFGMKGKPELPVQPLVRWHPVLGAAVAAALASFIVWWFDAAPMYATYLPVIAAQIPDTGVGVAVSFSIAAGLLGALWTLMFWPSIRRYRNGKRRFCFRVVLVFIALLNSPLIATAIILAGFASMLYSAVSRRR
jgi:hypothetical protein